MTLILRQLMTCGKCIRLAMEFTSILNEHTAQPQWSFLASILNLFSFKEGNMMWVSFGEK